jgi:sigma-E factor negative regulatory protein RseC
MAIEQGIVTLPGAIGGDTVWVKTVKPAACESCTSRKDCSMDKAGKPREVEVSNPVGAKIGDRVQISIQTSALLKAIFLLYLFPILCMLVGGFAGQVVSSFINTNDSITSMISAISCFVAALAVVHKRGGKMALKKEYQPKITRILAHPPKDDSDFSSHANCALDTTGSQSNPVR